MYLLTIGKGGADKPGVFVDGGKTDCLNFFISQSLPLITSFSNLSPFFFALYRHPRA